MTRAHAIALGVLGLTIAEMTASAPATPQPVPRKAKAYGPRSLVTHIDGVRLRRRLLMPRGDTRTKGPTVARERAVRVAWVPMAARASLPELEAQ